MTKKELIDQIKPIVQQVYQAVNVKVDLDATSTGISLDIERFPILSRFPSMKQAIEALLTNQYDLFIKDILWVAPRPSTFKIVLKNNQFLYIIATEKGWIAKIENKKYDLINLNSIERAADALSRILAYADTLGEETPTEEAPAEEETPTEEPPTEETPEEAPAEEETPEK